VPPQLAASKNSSEIVMLGHIC